MKYLLWCLCLLGVWLLFEYWLQRHAWRQQYGYSVISNYGQEDTT